MTRIPEGEAGSFFKHLTTECGRSNLPKKNLHSDLPGILSSGDFKSTGFERFLFSSHIPCLLTEILCAKLQSCLGLGLRAISVFCFLPDPWDSEEVQGTVNRKWYLKYRAVTLKCFVDSNSSKDLEKKIPCMFCKQDSTRRFLMITCPQNKPLQLLTSKE